MAESDGSPRAAELSVIERLLKPARVTRWPPPADAIIEVGDLETAYVVADEDGQGRFDERQRGQLRLTLTASTVAVALRFLTHRLAELARPTWWPLINPPEYASGVRLQAVDDGQRLSWDDDWLLFPQQRSVEFEARPFSWVVRAPAAEVMASYLEPSGAPLFQIDLAKEAPEFPRVRPPDEPHGWYSPEVRGR
jgi:hypothetical protein